MNKPPFLYHGSHIKTDVLLPHQAFDGLSDIGTAHGVFATPYRELALVFALGAKPDAHGRITRLVQSLDPINVVFLEGTPNVGGTGYIYVVESTSFEQLDDAQWISRKAVQPISVEEIHVDDHLNIVQYVDEVSKKELLSEFDHKQRRSS